jgi:hypothetical protein
VRRHRTPSHLMPVRQRHDSVPTCRESLPAVHPLRRKGQDQCEYGYEIIVLHLAVAELSTAHKEVVPEAQSLWLRRRLAAPFFLFTMMSRDSEE